MISSSQASPIQLKLKEIHITTYLDRLNNVFREVFEDEDLVITEATSAADIVGWDSVMHVYLIVTVEKVFGIRFTSSEVDALQCVGDLLDCVNNKMKGR